MGTPVFGLVECALVRLGHFLVRVKIWGYSAPVAEIWFSEKVVLGGYDLIFRSQKLPN